MFLLAVLLILLVVLFVRNNNRQQTALDKLNESINKLTAETVAMKEELRAQKQKPTELPQVPQPIPVPEPKKYPVYTPEPEPVKQSVPQAKPLMQQYKPQFIRQESWFSRWKKNNPDWEKFVGENLVNKIGIAVLVLGIAFFVKYAIDQEWINEVGRVSIGILCGGILTGLAHYLRNSYRSFSSVLAGGGIAVFYFSVAFAFHQYALISQTAAFIIMVAITAFAVALSVLYDRIELAVIAAVGGFMTPFMVSTGQGNYIVLFSYLIILNTGLLTLAYFKRWFLLNVISLGLTAFIFAGWTMSTVVNDVKVSFPLALLFATILYFIFLAMNMIYQVRKKEDFKAFDFSLLLFLNAGYFAIGMVLLSQVEGGRYHGLFTLFAGFVNLALAFYFFKRQNTYKNLLYLLIGLTLTYLSLSVPVQLEGHAITLFWSAEFVLLFWLWQRSRIPMFYYSSLLVMAFAVISLLMDWAAASNTDRSALNLIYLNTRGLVTNVVSILSFAVFARLLHQEKEALPVFDTIFLRRSATLVAIVLAYMTSIYGVNLYFRELSSYQVPNVYQRLVTEIFVVAFIIWVKREDHKLSATLQTGALSLYLLYHLFSFPLILGMRDSVLEGNHSSVHLFVHALTIGIFLWMLVNTVNTLYKAAYSYVPKPGVAWVLSMLVVVFFSHEFLHLFVVLAFTPGNIHFLEDSYVRAGVTIVWGLSSFTLMWLGMMYKTKTLRIISLSLFGIALMKLFFFDLVDISAGGKILAFTLLGVLLLTISFMYQKLKKIIIEDAK